MTRRMVQRLVWVGVALCVLLLGLGFADRMFGPPPGITEVNALRVQPGMTLAEVNGAVHFTRVLHGDPPSGGWQEPDASSLIASAASGRLSAGNVPAIGPGHRTVTSTNLP